MKIKWIELDNIGLYKKEKIYFENENKDVILIWGNNGAGKTTLLNSIKVSLLGVISFNGSYDDYVKFVSDSLISS